MNFQRIALAGLLSVAAATMWPQARAQDAAAELPGPVPEGRSIVPMDPQALALLSQPPQATPAPPAIKADEDGTRYLSGGITLEEREIMSDMARGFSLRITSARPDSALVPDIAIDIRDNRGRQVLAVSEAGPVVYVALPPGKYQVSANNGGQVATRQITVASGQQRELAFFWQG